VRLQVDWCCGSLRHRYVEGPSSCSSAEGPYRGWCCSLSVQELVKRLQKIQISSPHQHEIPGLAMSALFLI